jgi:hypothetical protein
MGIAEFGVQAGYHFTGRTGGAFAGSIAPSLRSGDGFVDVAGRSLVLPALEMLARRRREGFGGLDGYGACGHGAPSARIGCHRAPIVNKANSIIRHRERSAG